MAVSPIDGVVLVKGADVGEVLAPGTTVLTVGDIDHPWLRGYINETDLGKVKLGSKVKVTTDSYPGKVYNGRVTFISSEAEFTPKQIQTKQERVKLVYRVKIEVENPEPRVEVEHAGGRGDRAGAVMEAVIETRGLTTPLRRADRGGPSGPDGLARRDLRAGRSGWRGQDHHAAHALRADGSDRRQARVAGHDAARESRAVKDRIGYMAQRFGLYTDLTVDENMDFLRGPVRHHGAGPRKS